MYIYRSKRNKGGTVEKSRLGCPSNLLFDYIPNVMNNRHFFPVSSPFVKPFPVFIIQKLEMRESHLFIQFILFIMQQKGPWNHSAPVSWMFWTTGIDQHFRYLINFWWIVQAQRRFTSWLYSFHCAIDLLQCYSTHLIRSSTSTSFYYKLLYDDCWNSIENH